MDKYSVFEPTIIDIIVLGDLHTIFGGEVDS